MSLFKNFRRRVRLPRVRLPRLRPGKLPGIRQIGAASAGIGRAIVEFKPPKWFRGKIAPVEGENPRLADYFNPILWVSWGVLFMWRWLLTRPYLSLGAAVPAVFVGLGLALLAINLSRKPANWRNNIYRNHLRAGLEAENPEQVRLAFMTLTSLAPRNADLQFQRLQYEASQGETDAARGYAYRLVTEHQHGPAAVWLANDLMVRNESEGFTAESIQQIRGLLELAIGKLRGNERDAARLQLIRYMEITGASTDARRLADEMADVDQRFALQAAVRSLQAGDSARSQKLASAAIAFYRQLLTDQPFDFDARVNLVRSMQLSGDFDEREAIEIFRDGYRLTGDERLLTGQSELALLRSERLARDTSTDPNKVLIERFQLLDLALTATPNNAQVLGAVSKLMLEQQVAPGEEINAIRMQLLGKAGDQLASFVAATQAMMAGDDAEAMRIFNRLAEQNPGLPSVLNNMAVVLANSPNGDLEQALALAEQAIIRAPNHPYLRDTRGQILVKLGRYGDALNDLEAALAAPELHPEVLPAMAEAYRGMGNSQLAEVYQRRAESAKEKAAEAKP